MNPLDAREADDTYPSRPFNLPGRPPLTFPTTEPKAQDKP